MGVPTLPDNVPVIRLEDAGMAEQMAEYVTLAVLRAYREMDAYAAQQRNGVWQPRARIAKASFGVGFLGFGVLAQAVSRARCVRLSLHAWSRTRKTAPGVVSYAGIAELDEFLARRTCSSVCCPRHRIPRRCSTALYTRTLPSALVNVARGGIVSTRIWSRCSTKAISPARRSTCSARNRCRTPFWHHPRIT
jgi:glyoxylate/hydroxypyruvate reductase A